MLKKSWRLQTKEDFERVFRSGKPLFFGAVGCKVAKNDREHLRLGFSLSKKYLKTAVERNRLRRVLAEAFAISLAGRPPLSFDVVCFVVKKPQESDFQTFASVAQSVVEYINNSK